MSNKKPNFLFDHWWSAAEKKTSSNLYRVPIGVFVTRSNRACKCFGIEVRANSST